jgi:hypothetical protein
MHGRAGQKNIQVGVFRCQPRYLSEGSSSLAADVVLAETHHAVRAGELGLIYQDSLFEATSCSLRGALFLRERSFDPKPFNQSPLRQGRTRKLRTETHEGQDPFSLDGTCVRDGTQMPCSAKSH